MSKPVVSVVKCADLPGNPSFLNGKFQRKQEDLEIIKKAVKDAVEMAVGSVDNIVKEGQTVLIKPNIAFLAPPESFAVVDPRMIEAVVWYFKTQSKAKEVWIGDNPSLGMHVGRARPALETAGMTAAAIAGGADKIIYFDEEPVVKVEIPGATFFREAEVFKPFLDADVVINLPKLKVHLAGTLTLGLKNWNGIVPNVHPSGQQQGVHRVDLGQKMADMYRIRKADLTIIDALIGMEGQGPHAGTPVEMNLVIAGTDTVAVDAVGASIMGFEPMEVPAIRCAGTDGLGEHRLENIEVVGVPVSKVRKFFKRPNGDPVGMYKDFTVFAQQTCPGCYVNVRGALDSFVNTGVDLEEFVERNGPVLVIGGGVPDFEPEMAKGKNLFITGDCWKYFPTRDKVEEAIKLAKSVTYSSLFLAFSVLLPMLFHFFGGAGQVFLPMHIPVLLTGFILGPVEGFLVGLLAPLLGFLFTGMPAVPEVYFMLFELSAYGFFSGLFYKNRALGLYPSLVLSMILGRILLAASLLMLQPLLDLSLSPTTYLIGGLTTGLPGMLIQLIFLPPTVKLLEKAGEYLARDTF